jgi:hypothetical protein
MIFDTVIKGSCFFIRNITWSVRNENNKLECCKWHKKLEHLSLE